MPTDPAEFARSQEACNLMRVSPVSEGNWEKIELQLRIFNLFMGITLETLNHSIPGEAYTLSVLGARIPWDQGWENALLNQFPLLSGNDTYSEGGYARFSHNSLEALAGERVFEELLGSSALDTLEQIVAGATLDSALRDFIKPATRILTTINDEAPRVLLITACARAFEDTVNEKLGAIWSEKVEQVIEALATYEPEQF